MHTRGYLDTLDAAGLIDHDGDHRQIIAACATASSMRTAPTSR